MLFVKCIEEMSLVMVFLLYNLQGLDVMEILQEIEGVIVVAEEVIVVDIEVVVIEVETAAEEEIEIEV